jgi:hypothetical protein
MKKAVYIGCTLDDALSAAVFVQCEGVLNSVNQRMVSLRQPLYALKRFSNVA